VTPGRRAALFVLVLAASLAGAAQEAPRTWRVDFYETGGPGLEAYSLDRVVVEPLAWPDSRANDLAPPGIGNYRFEVVDAGGRVVFSRPFDPAFAEWVTTAESKRVRRSFHDSLRFPAPAGRVEIVLRKRSEEGAYPEVWRLAVDPADPSIDRALPPRQQAIEIVRSGAPSTKVDVLLLGDGYTAGECGAKFRADARRMADALFAQAPFSSRRASFNVWGLCPPAAESGISRPSTGIYRSSPAGSSYDAFGSERYILTFANRALRDLASWAPYEYLTILVNGRTYGGGGLYNVYATAAVDNDWAGYLFVHEFGHHFAGLADEYYTSPVAYEPPSRIVEPWPPNVTATADRDRLKWRDLVAPDTPLPTPWPKPEFEAMSKGFQERRARLRVEKRPEEEMSALFREEQTATTKLFAGAAARSLAGAFQGANYDAQAFYRPEMDCIMFTRNRVPFCRVCQRAIVEAIERHAR
jgi:hypothetical protein